MFFALKNEKISGQKSVFLVYLAIEHNTKYLAMLAEAADSERVYAITKLQSQTEDLKRYKEENEDMQKKTKML